MDTKEITAGQLALKVATNGENKNIGEFKYSCDWHDFFKFVGIWIITSTVLFCALIIITIVNGSSNIIYDTIKDTNTLNIVFSLVLSALLEQIWSKNGKTGLYDFTLGFEGVLAIIGGMLFMAYSIVQTLTLTNKLLQLSFYFNVGYIIISTIVVLMGFFSRSIR